MLQLQKVGSLSIGRATVGDECPDNEGSEMKEEIYLLTAVQESNSACSIIDGF